MIEKIKEIIVNDDLLPHKVGLILGCAFGLLIGGLISDKADQLESKIVEEVSDGEKEA